MENQELFKEFAEDIKNLLADHEDDFTLDISDKIWQDADIMRLNKEQEDEIAGILTDFIDKQIEKQADEILYDEIEKYPMGYKIKFEEGRKISVTSLSEVYNDCVCDPMLSFNNEIEDQIFYDWEMGEFYDNMVEKIFRLHRTDEELAIVDRYIEKNGISLCAALENRYFNFISVDIGEVVGEQKFAITLRTDSEAENESISISEIFCNGDTKALKEKLSEMNSKEILDHFNSAVIYLLHQQGHSLEEFADVYFGKKDTDSDMIRSIINGLKEHPDLCELNVYATVDGNSIADLIEAESDSIDCFVKFPRDTVIELSNGKDTSISIKLEKPLIVYGSMIESYVLDVSEEIPYKKCESRLEVLKDTVINELDNFFYKYEILNPQIDSLMEKIAMPQGNKTHSNRVSDQLLRV